MSIRINLSAWDKQSSIVEEKHSRDEALSNYIKIVHSQAASLTLPKPCL